jgi:hypothetical protein
MAPPAQLDPRQPDQESVTPNSTTRKENPVMTDRIPGITPRPPMSLDKIAIAAAGLIADARTAGLAPPCALNCHDYSPPAVGLYVSEHDTTDIWRALQAWADHYNGELATRPSSSPGAVHAITEFRHDGIRYQVSSIITTPGDDGQPDSQTGTEEDRP